MKRLIRKIAAITPEQYIQGYPSAYEHVQRGIETINVNDIIGMTLGRNEEYDDNFQPIGNPDDRWLRLYNRAKEEGNLDFAGPISVVKVPNENKYFIYDDGNHRLSVAKALNIQTLQAEVTVLIPKEGKEYEEMQQKYDELTEKINELQKKLKEYNSQQQKLYDNRGLTLDEIDKKYDEIEQLKNPLYKQVDDLWAERERIRDEFAFQKGY